ncbi:hypothetical protein BLNAU_14647 [Blattamonas nauphoetae]|uniref:Uncharacterized protein n=1 Tax=Blattamonas nauphoetae TaxID=2049346 RepID=A0ABQ9XD28_9EUKA|nr:hypothetical protein BLNAU_14647 [Blattamonas nauphoetae]
MSPEPTVTPEPPSTVERTPLQFRLRLEQNTSSQRPFIQSVHQCQCQPQENNPTFLHTCGLQTAEWSQTHYSRVCIDVLDGENSIHLSEGVFRITFVFHASHQKGVVALYVPSPEPMLDRETGWKKDEFAFWAGGQITCNGVSFHKNNAWNDGDQVTIELNMSSPRRTARLLINEQQQQTYFTGLPESLVFCAHSFLKGSSVTVQSLERLSLPLTTHGRRSLAYDPEVDFSKSTGYHWW